MMAIILSFAISLSFPFPRGALAATSGHGQITIVGPAIPFLNLEEIARDVKRSVFSVQVEGNLTNANKEDDYNSLGTGFLIEKNKIVLGITCNHVISAAQKNRKAILIGLDTGTGYQRFECEILKQDEKNDIAILLPRKSGKSTSVSLNNLVLNVEYLADTTAVVEGRAVLIPGYPLGLGLEYDENHPVIKIGVVAQYTGRDVFLIDGVVNPGNSGSPVFDLYQKKFVGMVQSFANDFINVVDKNGPQRKAGI